MRQRFVHRLAGPIALAALAAAASACHWKSPIEPMVAGKAANTLALPASVINAHPDPETVRGALDYALLQNEALLASTPKHESLLLTLCSQYVQYATWFVQPDAEAVQFSDTQKSQATLARAYRLASRGKDLCWRGLEAEDKGISERLTGNADVAAHRLERDNVPLLYWSAASLMAQIMLGPEGRADVAPAWKIVRALAERALALDDTWNRAALHELMITVESQGAAGGTEAAARKHFTRAIEVQQGLSPGPYVALAMGVSRPKRDRAEFEKLLTQAASVDPDKNPTNRLPVMIGRQRAQVLLGQADRLLAR
jgi:hypothetical protein